MGHDVVFENFSNLPRRSTLRQWSRGGHGDSWQAIESDDHAARVVSQWQKRIVPVLASRPGFIAINMHKLAIAVPPNSTAGVKIFRIALSESGTADLMYL